MEYNKECRLCFKIKKQLINIFNHKDLKLNIAEILTKHFWFKVFENDGLSNVVCNECWRKTLSFHKFYNNIKTAYNINSKTIKHSIDNAVDIKPILNEVEIPIKVETNFIKIEEMMIPDENDNDNFLNNIDYLSIKTNEKVLLQSNNNSNISTINDEKNIALEDIRSLNIENILNDECSLFDNNANNNDKTEDCDDKTKLSVNEKYRKQTIIHNEKYQVENKITLPKVKMNRFKSVKNQNQIVPQKSNINAEERKLKIEMEDEQIREYFKMICDVCNFKFSTFLEARSHYRKVHNINGYLSCCKRKFIRRGTILEHVTHHLNPDAYKCKYCNKNYENKISLKLHEDSHIDADHKPYKCDICTKSYQKLFVLTHHKKYCHCKEEDKKFVCDDCGKSFMSKSILRIHIRGVHQFAYAHICDICAKVFKSKQVFELHRESKCGTDVKLKSQCDICGAWLRNERSLRRHLSQHNDTDHKCPKCGKITPNRIALASHIRSVHSGKTYVCTLCSKIFKTTTGLREHMASHTGEVLYTCPHCPKTFNSNANMHAHRKKIHPIEWQQNRRQRIIKKTPEVM